MAGPPAVPDGFLPDVQWAFEDVGETALPDRPSAAGHTLRPPNEEAFRTTPDERPAAISLRLGVPGDLAGTRQGAPLRGALRGSSRSRTPGGPSRSGHRGDDFRHRRRGTRHEQAGLQRPFMPPTPTASRGR
ncbi:hypothetical protein SGRIM128S_00425 [Streptomyces griseomycini]